MATLVSILTMILGLFLCSKGILSYLDMRKKEAYGTRTKATIVEIIRKESEDNEGHLSVTYWPIYEYRRAKASTSQRNQNIHLLTLFGAFLLLSSCTESKSILGHWKCDTTGTVTTSYKDETITKPVQEFYDGFKTLPFEMEFKDDGLMIWHQRKPDESYSTKEAFYYPNYKGEKNKVMIRTNKGDDENIMTIKSITKDMMNIQLESVEDEMFFDLIMNKI